MKKQGFPSYTEFEATVSLTCETKEIEISRGHFRKPIAETVI
jgi:hypothetical protein